MAREDFILRKMKQLGRKLGYELVNAADPAEVFSVLLRYRSGQRAGGNEAFVSFVLRNFSQSSAQLFQDLFVLFSLELKSEGYFVEFGAANGVDLSNTVLLERAYGWRGILAEPAKCWHQDLRVNRRCAIDTRCVWSKSGERIEFNEVPERELSTIDRYSSKDAHLASRSLGTVYPVETVSLNDLLAGSNAPKAIDYLSVDTEGSELDILKAFDFAKYDVRIITVEHNFTPDRDAIHGLLVSKGFSRVLERFSLWDDWYIKAGSTEAR